MSPVIAERAGRLLPTGMRSLDAVHLATALSVPGIAAFGCHDAGLTAAAAASGLAVLNPA